MNTTTPDPAALLAAANLPDYLKAGGDINSVENQRVLRDFVGRNVIHCASTLIYDLAKWEEGPDYDIIVELCSPVQDFESALEEATEDDADWSYVAEYLDVSLDRECGDPDRDALRAIRDSVTLGDRTAQEVCEEARIDPHEREVFEHWIVDDWFAEELARHGEKTDKVHGLTIWARTTTGQAILLDYVIEQLAAEQQILVGQANDWSRG